MAIQSLIDLLHYRLLLGFDEISLGRLARCCTFLRDIAAEQALWRRLATCSDRLAAARYFGVLSPEAGEIISTDSDPPAQHNKPLDGATVDWRDVCRQLHPSVAVRPWDVEATQDNSSCRGVWAELTDGWHNGHNVEGLPEGGIFGSQSPCLFWVGGSQLLAVSGIFFAEVLGGANDQLLNEVYFVDILDQALRAGMNVVIDGLVAAAELNGQMALCEGWIEDIGRWSVRLENGDVKAIKSENLRPQAKDRERDRKRSRDARGSRDRDGDRAQEVDHSEEVDAENTSSPNRGRSLRRRLLDTIAGRAPIDPRATSHPCGVRVERLDCGTANDALPRGHPSLNGAASDFDPIRRTAYFFGGGSPHAEVFNVTSALRLSGWAGEQRATSAVHGAEQDLEVAAGDQGEASVSPSARWEVVPTLAGSRGAVEAGQCPSGRQGVRGVVFCDEFIIFGGRERGGTCANDVWSLDLSSDISIASAASSSISDDGTSSPPASKVCHWRPLICEGTAPSPRVWYTACHAVHGKWFIYGGSTWQFQEPAEPHDYQILFILDLAGRSWSSIDPRLGPDGTRLPWVVGAGLVPLGSSQMLLLGGVKPHKVGEEGLTEETLQRWRTWYGRLDQPHLFDLATESWSQQSVAVLPPTPHTDLETHVADNCLRAQFAAVFVPTRRSVVVFGGSRYFTGEYFHDIMELHLPATSSPTQRTSVLGDSLLMDTEIEPLGDFQTPQRIPRFFDQRQRRRTQSSITRGLLGRLRAMKHNDMLTEEQFQDILRRL